MVSRKLALAWALALLAVSGTSSGAVAAAAAPQAKRADEAVTIPFDPPAELTYRWQKTDDKDGAVTMSWSVDRYRFTEDESGYRLAIEPVASGSDEKDPRKLRAMKTLDALTRRPYALRLDADAAIVEMERADAYWAAIVTALRAGLTEPGEPPEVAEALKQVIAMFETMPAEARLKLLTEPLQPAVEFAFTEHRLDKPISLSVEAPFLFGGTVQQDLVISLTKADERFAYVTVRSSIPRKEIERMTRQLVAMMPKAAREASGDIEAQIAALKAMQSETIADYKLWREDGVLESFQSTRTISVQAEGKTSRRVTTTSLTRVD